MALSQGPEQKITEVICPAQFSLTDANITNCQMQPLDISLNIYDYTRANCVLGVLGVGLYHTGIEIKYARRMM